MTIHMGPIGAGNISQKHARAARAILGVQIAAVFGSNAERVRQLAAEHGAAWPWSKRSISRAAWANAKYCLARPSAFLEVAPSSSSVRRRRYREVCTLVYFARMKRSKKKPCSLRDCSYFKYDTKDRVTIPLSASGIVRICGCVGSFGGRAR
jgi:hypothetical protein